MSNVPDDWTEEERAILRSAEDDAPRAASMDKAVAVAAAATALSVGTSVAHATGVVLVAKWLGVVALGTAVVAGTVYAVRRPPPAVPAVPALSAAASVAAEPAASAAPAAQPSAPSSSVATPRTARREPAAAATQPDIALEISAIDAARKALRAGDAAGALSELDRYEGRVGRSGSLAPEAAVLRIEALLLRGDRARAKALADAFLAGNPKSPLAARVRALFP